MNSSIHERRLRKETTSDETCHQTDCRLPLALVLPCRSAACDTSLTAAEDRLDVLKVGFITKFPVDFYDIMVDAVKKYDAEHADVEVIFGQGKSGTDDEGEIATIENMIAQSVKAIAITPTSPNVQTALDKAVARRHQGRPHRQRHPRLGRQVLGRRHRQPGRRQARRHLAGREPSGRREDRHPAGPARQPVARRPGQGHARRPSATRPRSSASRRPTATRPRGSTPAQDMLTANPDLTAIYGACGPPIIGALEAIKAAGKKPGDIVVVGFDASPDEVAAIKAGDQSASVAQFPAKMGSLGIETAVDAARGQTVQANVDTGTEMVTKDNAANFS